MRVFIVDDYTTMLRILRNLLRQLDINSVEEATNGDTAYHMLQKDAAGSDHFRLEHGAGDRPGSAAQGAR